MKYQLIFIVLTCILLSSCATNSERVSCIDSTTSEVQLISTSDDLSPFWIPTKNNERVKESPSVEVAIAGGRIGYVVVNQTIDTDGNVIDVNVLESYPDNYFVKPALRQAKQYKFQPVTCNPVAVRHQYVYYFTNSDEASDKLHEIQLQRTASL